MTWRLLAVHAHPDDETITTGGTLARYAQAGVAVTVVTCTLGEEGEIIPPTLHGLESDRADQLGGYRLVELRQACAALGVSDHRYLGGLGKYRDSGMIGTPSANHPRAFVHAAAGGPKHQEAVADLLAVIEDVRPHVLLTYAADGGYGHPDHVTAHQVATEAGRLGAVPRILAAGRTTAMTLAALAEYQAPAGYRPAVASDLGYRLDEISVTIDVRSVAAERTAALAAHETQITVLPGGFALSNRIGQPVFPVESYYLLAGHPYPDGKIADDLFAGLTQ